jgi:hypothetical protein
MCWEIEFSFSHLPFLIGMILLCDIEEGNVHMSDKALNCTKSAVLDDRSTSQMTGPLSTNDMQINNADVTMIFSQVSIKATSPFSISRSSVGLMARG